MLDSLFTKGFKASKCKTLLKLTIPRIKLLRNRRVIQVKQMRREIAKLLETGQEATARIRVEHIIREEKMMAAQEIVELFCELIAARLPIIETQRACPLDLKEAISSVCFAAPRCADLPELQQVQMLFAGKYGKEFVASATDLMPECGVNRQLVELLSIRAPTPDVKLKLLEEIAKEHEVDWDPSASESELLKTHEDLLNGPVQFVSGSKMPLPEAQHEEAKSTASEPDAGEHPDSDEDYEIIDFPEVPRQALQSNKGANSEPEMLPFPAAALDEQEPNLSQDKVNLSHLEPRVVWGLNPKMKEDTVEQFVPFIRPPSQSYAPFPLPVTEHGSPPSITKTVNDDADLQDVLAAAQAAADTAESASAAARSAASLAQLRITELMKKQNDDFSSSDSENPFHLDKTKPDLEEEAELDAENPFARSDTPFTSPGRNNTSENYMANQPMTHHLYDDAKGDFGSYPQSDNGFSYGSLDRPQRLASMDDDTYFSYPNLFTSQGSK
ncbi:Regulator of Vps4 activity in the MVB pathway protein [Perilla frutescens var. frutescens]|nr:Regulator of Vps4 activity in the MVB pathway protein [Perilla frutescens var. frutescens]